MDNGLSVGGTSISIKNNYIGTNIFGTRALPNKNGIKVWGGGMIIGGSTAAERNLISGNTQNGIWETGGTAITIKGNYIGTDLNGVLPIPNNYCGVSLASAGCIIGGTGSGERNIISGNLKYGIELSSYGDTITGNYIGTMSDGKHVLPNVLGGILLSGYNNVIGHSGSGEPNLISGNTGPGITVTGFWNKIIGNHIGTKAGGVKSLPNQGDGISITTPINPLSGNTIGGTNAGESNIIAYNTNGITISGTASTGNWISRNSIFWLQQSILSRIKRTR